MRPEPPTDESLARRSCPEPSADFRARLLAEMARTRERTDRSARRWWLAGRIAALVVLALNLAMSAENGVRYHRLTVRSGSAEGPAMPYAKSPDDSPFSTRALERLSPAPDIGAL